MCLLMLINYEKAYVLGCMQNLKCSQQNWSMTWASTSQYFRNVIGTNPKGNSDIFCQYSGSQLGSVIIDKHILQNIIFCVSQKIQKKSNKCGTAWVNDDRIFSFGWTISLGAVNETHPVLTCISSGWWSPGGPGADSFAWGPSHWWWEFLVYGRETPSRAPVQHTPEPPHPERQPGNEANLY